MGWDGSTFGSDCLRGCEDFSVIAEDIGSYLGGYVLGQTGLALALTGEIMILTSKLLESDRDGEVASFLESLFEEYDYCGITIGMVSSFSSLSL